MLVEEMTAEECRALLARASVGRLGCSLDNQPYVVPVCLAYELDHIYIFSTFGKKIEWMRSNNKVCVQTDEITTASEWASVIADGSYQELSAKKFELDRVHARELLEKRNRWWLNALAERRQESYPDLSIEPLFFRIKVDSISGLRARTENDAAPRR
jgi:uncharacterized protein